MTAHNFIDITGVRFGRLVAISQGERINKKVARWNCVCDCGKRVVVEGKSLRHNMTKSCGCLHSSALGDASRTHGLTGSDEYKIWCGIKRRCYNTNEHCYPRYGGRGIKMANTWRHDFLSFYADMGKRPSPIHSIERIDTNGNYEPNNCIWITMAEQAKNKRSNIVITFNGETMILADWSKKLGIPYPTLQRRLNKGWSHEKALTTPVDKKYRNTLTKKSP